MELFRKTSAILTLLSIIPLSNKSIKLVMALSCTTLKNYGVYTCKGLLASDNITVLYIPLLCNSFTSISLKKRVAFSFIMHNYCYGRHSLSSACCTKCPLTTCVSRDSFIEKTVDFSLHWKFRKTASDIKVEVGGLSLFRV